MKEIKKSIDQLIADATERKLAADQLKEGTSAQSDEGNSIGGRTRQEKIKEPVR